MEVWSIWLASIHGLLGFLSAQVGLGAGLGVVALTLLLRSVVLPLSWSIAYRGSIRQKKMRVLQPQLALLKRECGDRPQVYAERTMKLYRDRGISIMEWRGLMGALVQFPVMLGVFQTLRAGVTGARFLWAQSLARPDPWFAILAGMTTLLVMMANPDLPEGMRLILIAVPCVIATIAALKFCSALALYWTVSNTFTAAQTYVMHHVIGRRIKSGRITL